MEINYYVFQYLIEWGCDVHNKNVKGQTVLETIKNDDFKRYLMGKPKISFHLRQEHSLYF